MIFELPRLRTTLSIAAAAFVLGGCAQHGAAMLPATPSAVRAASPSAASAPSTNLKLQFPTPAYTSTLFASSSIWMLSPTTFVEEDSWGKQLSYRFGTLVNNVAAWGQRQVQGVTGIEPQITANGSTVVDVHYDYTKGLVYIVGKLGGSNALAWGTPTYYDSGSSPHVAFTGSTSLVEVHYGSGGNLWYHFGTLVAPAKSITFGKSIPLDSGYYPSVAANGNGVAIALHAGSSYYGYSHLYYQIGVVKANAMSWGSSIAIPDTASSVADVTWSPQGQIVVTYLCSAPYPFNVYYLCTQMGTLDAAKTSISWYGTSKSSLIDANIGSVSTALNGNAAITILESSNGNREQYATSFLSDRSNWEGDRLTTTLKGKTLGQIAFPASHDAAMYVDKSGGVGAEALAQDEDIYHQLLDGSRYFDLRPDGNLSFNHGPVDGGSVDTVLQDVAKFMKEGHREVVILKFSHFDFPENSTDPSVVQQRIAHTLGPWLYHNTTGKRLADIPLSDLINVHGIVLPLWDSVPSEIYASYVYTYRDYEQTHDPASGEFTAFDQYTDTLSYSKMKTDQLAKFTTFDGKMLNAPATPCDFFLLSWTLTPVSLVYSVAPEANAQLGSVMSTVTRNSHGKIPNILYVDFVEWSGAADVAIAMNARL
jgi:hypothetical protein